MRNKTKPHPFEDPFQLEIPESNHARLNREAKNERDSKRRARQESRLENDYWN